MCLPMSILHQVAFFHSGSGTMGRSRSVGTSIEGFWSRPMNFAASISFSESDFLQVDKNIHYNFAKLHLLNSFRHVFLGRHGIPFRDEYLHNFRCICFQHAFFQSGKRCYEFYRRSGSIARMPSSW